MGIESLGDDPDIELDYEDSIISKADVGSVPEEKQNDEMEMLLEERTTKKPTTPSMPGTQKRISKDIVAKGEEGLKKTKEDTGRDSEKAKVSFLPSKTTASCTVPIKRSGEILVRQETHEDTRSNQVRVTCNERIMYENTVTINKEMAIGDTSINIGQYIKGKVISPDSLRLVMGSSGEIRLVFNVDN